VSEGAADGAADGAPSDPLAELAAWIEEARENSAPHPAATAFVTVGADGAPSARTVTLKRIEPDALLFTSALWTRKAQEVAANPRVALLFHWPSLGRQVHVSGEAALAERPLAEELFAERDPAHRRQTVVSRQGEEIESLEPLRDLLAHQERIEEAPPPCPPDWGALRVTPSALEFWRESPDRLHERRLFRRDAGAWTLSLLAP
jgi:pyridoxamine 5'-phosphate oxidase